MDRKTVGTASGLVLAKLCLPKRERGRERGRERPAGSVGKKRERGAEGGLGGPCGFHHWHVRHDEPVWLKTLLFTPPFLFSPLSLSLSLSCSRALSRPLKLLRSPSLVLPLSQPSYSLSSLFILATLPPTGPVENVIGGQGSRRLSGFRHHEWVHCTAWFFCQFQLVTGHV